MPVKQIALDVAVSKNEYESILRMIVEKFLKRADREDRYMDPIEV